MTSQAAGTVTPHRVLLVTGGWPNLTAPVLAEMALPFAYDVTVLKITVAALMTTTGCAPPSSEQVPDGTDLVMIPGLCEGDALVLGERLRVPVEKGQKTCASCRGTSARLPRRTSTAHGTSTSSPNQQRPRLTREAVREAAEYFRSSGADIIDIGCTPGCPSPLLATSSASWSRTGCG